MKRVLLMIGVLLCKYALATNTPVSLTGFNGDVVANGVGAATGSTTHAVDSSGYAFITQDYQKNSSAALPSSYLPLNGLINSVKTPGLSFQLAGYSGFNALRLAGSGSGTLTFGTATSASIVYLLATSGSGISVATVTVTFSDNTTQVFTINVNDWYNNPGYTVANVGRVLRSSGDVDAASTTGPNLYEIPLALNVANFSKSIVSINIARSTASPSAATAVLNVLAVTTSNNTFAGGAYTINNAQPTGGSNFNNFTDAVTAISSAAITGPVTFTVVSGSGPYNERIALTPVAGASSVNKVVFNCNGATMAYSTSDANNRTAITLNGADFITFDSLNVDVSAGTYGWGIVLMAGADSNVIRRCRITTNTTSIASNYMGIMLNGSATALSSSGNNGNGNLLENNTITGGYYGLYVYGSTSPYNSGNIFRNNKVYDFYLYGCYVYGQQNLTISANEISRPARTTVSTTYGIYLSSGNGGYLVEKNVIHDVFPAGYATNTAAYLLYIATSGTAAAPNRMENNLVYNIGGTGYQYGIYGASYSNWNMYHNTIVLDDQNATTSTTYGMYVYGTVGMNVKNNIIYINRGGTGIKYCLYYSTTGVTSSNNNVLYMGSTTGSTYIGYYSSNRISFTDWQSTGFDANSSAVNPAFAGSGSFLPTEASINNMGAQGLGVSTDIAGVTRGMSPDPGAYEFSVAGVDGGLSWVSPVTPASAGNQTVTVKLFNNSASTNITAANLSYTDGTSIQTQNFTGLNVAPAGTVNLSFTTPYNITGNVKLAAYINTVNGAADISQANDTAKATVCFALSGTYTINAGQPTGGTNFASFTDAAAALGCGGITGPVTLNVAAGSGPYTDRFVLPYVSGASSVNRVTINGNGETLTYSGNVNNPAAIVLNGADFITIDSLTVDVSAGTYGWGVALAGGADSNVIRRLHILNNTSSTNSYFAGIVVSASANSMSVSGDNGNGNIIENNTITGGYYGINLYGNITTYSQNNIIRNNLVQEFYYYGIYLYGQQNAVISNNEVTRPTRTTLSSGYCIYLSTSNGGILVEKNRIHDVFPSGSTTTSTAAGIYAITSGTAAASNVLVNNLIYNMGGNGTQYGIYAAGYNYYNIYHNTISLDDQSASNATTYGMYAWGSTSTNVKNNIVSVTRSGTGTKYCLFYSTIGVTSSNNNVLYMGSAGGSNSIGYYNTPQANLATWQSNGFDANSSAANPQFAGSGSYKPTEFYINNKGATGLGVLTDIDNVTRGAAPDPGAYEFDAAGTDAGISWVSPVTATMGNATVSVRITNNSSSASVTTVNLSYTDGTIVRSQAFTGLSIAPAASQVLSFTTPYNVTGNVNLATYINTVNGATDVSQVNDTARYAICFALNGTYTINQNIPASNSNFTSLTAAARALSCGGITGPVVFNVASGSSFQEPVTFFPFSGASATNTVIINGNAATITYNSADANARAAVTIDGADHLTLDNFVIDASGGTYGWGVLLMDQADSNIIRNCTITASVTSTSLNYLGVVFSASGSSYSTSGNNGNGNLVEGNTINGGYYGICVYGSTSAYNTGNIIRNNTLQNWYYYGIYVYGNQNALVSGNDLSRPNRTTGGSYGVYISTNNGGMLVEKNRIHNLYDAATSSTTLYAYYLNSGTAASPNRLENNLLYNIGGDASIYGVYGLGISNWNIYHNSIILDNRSTTTGISTYGMYVYGTTAVNVKNNIIFITRTGTGTKYCLYYSSTGVTSSNNNVLYMGATDGTAATGYFSSAKASLTDWQGTGFDVNSSGLNPQFDVSGNFKPTESSIDNIGAAGLGVTTDIYGVTRGANPDPGVAEFGSSLPVQLVKFSGSRRGGLNLLEWTTANETNNSGFEVERSLDGTNFSSIGFVASKAVNGTGNANLTYSLNDSRITASASYYYRLKQMDKDGRFRYYNVVFVKGTAVQLELVKVYPNPVTSQLNIAVSSPAAGTITLLLSDATGRVVLQKSAAVSIGTTVVELGVSRLAQGVYFLKAICADGCTSGEQKIIKQ
jgi:parallel beta-helix repeat protein